MNLDFLLVAYGRTHDPATLQAVTHTLTKMAWGGIYDQLGGGFHRYSTDDLWLVPHFEKMLYDNAQLARTYLHAWQVTGNPLFRRIVEETLDYVTREMTDPAGGFTVRRMRTARGGRQVLPLAAREVTAAGRRGRGCSARTTASLRAGTSTRAGRAPTSCTSSAMRLSWLRTWACRSSG